MVSFDLKNLFYKAYKKYYDSTPLVIKKAISPIVFFIKFRILSRIKNIYLPVYLVRGKEKHEKENISLLFLGDNISYYHIANQLFFEEPQREFVRNIFIWNIPKYLDSYTRTVDAVFIKTDRFFSRFLHKKNFIILPAWVELKLDVSQPMEEIYKKFKKSATEDIRIIKKNEYTYEITNDSSKFEYFYHNIRLPYLTQRLGKLTIPATTSYEETRDIFQRGKLLLVKKGKNIISGILLVNYRDSSHACYMGIAEPSHYLSTGAGAALYYFSILWAKENNIKILDFGNNRSFLNDGSFQYKRKWGSSVTISKRFFDIFCFKIYNYKSKAIQSFLANNPFTYIDKNQLYGIIFLKDLINSDEIKRINENYYTPGIKQLFMINLNNDMEQIIKKIFEKDAKDLKLSILDDTKHGTELLSGAIISYQNDKLEIEKIVIDADRIEEKNLIKSKVEQHISLLENSKLNDEQKKQIIISGYEKKFERLLIQFPEQKNVILKTFLNTFATLKKRGMDPKKIDDKILVNVFSAFSDGKYDKEAVPEILIYLLEHNTEDIDDAITACNLYILDETEIIRIIRETVTEKKEFIKQYGLNAHDLLMGIIMKKIRGKANGETISRLLKKEIQRLI